MVGVGTKLGVLAGPVDNPHGHLEALRQVLGRACQLFELRLVVRGMEPPRHLEVAVDLLVANELADPAQRVMPVPQDGGAGLVAIARGQFGKPGLDTGADLAAIARAAAKARIFCIQHHHAAAGARQHEGRVKAGIARPDDDHVGAGWQVCLFQPGSRGLVPPVRFELESGRKEGIGHRRGVPSAGGSATQGMRGQHDKVLSVWRILPGIVTHDLVACTCRGVGQRQAALCHQRDSSASSDT